MKKGAMVGLGCLGVIVIVAIIVALSTMGTYNSLVAAREEVNTSWAQVENVYQRRADLIPNLVATVKGYAAHETETLQAVTASRAQVGSMKITPEMLNNRNNCCVFSYIRIMGPIGISRIIFRPL